MMNRNLRTRLFWLNVILLIYRFGQKIPLPWVNLHQIADNGGEESVFSTFVTLTGGNINHFSILSVGLAPWMTSMIVWQIFAQNKQNTLKKIPKEKIDKIKYGICFLIAIFQSIGVYLLMTQERHLIGDHIPAVYSLPIIVTVLVSGTFFVVWLANMNTEYGFGGISSIILANVISRFAQGFFEIIKDFSQPNQAIDHQRVLLIAIVLAFILPFWIYIHQIEIHYPLKRPMINNKYVQKAYIPIKLNTAGAMPIMFSVTFFMIPQYLLTIFKYFLPENDTVEFLIKEMQLTKPIGVVVYLLGLLILSMFFSFFNYNVRDLAENLQKNGDYLVGIQPGRPTYQFIAKRLFAFSLVGSFFLMLISGVPMFFSLNQPELLSLTMLPGTILIVISISLSLIQEWRLYQLQDGYQPLFDFQ